LLLLGFIWVIQQDYFTPYVDDEIIPKIKEGTLLFKNAFGDYGWILVVLFITFWLIFNGCFWGLINGFRGAEIQKGEKPNQGIFRSMKIATIFFIFGMLCEIGFAKADFSPFEYNLMFGSICGLIYGGNACIRHLTLRLILYSNGYAPWNYTRFLNYATERLFLQKVGGGYIFVHRMLLEHFAEMLPEQEDR
jgi:hypothetical protein